MPHLFADLEAVAGRSLGPLPREFAVLVRDLRLQTVAAQVQKGVSDQLPRAYHQQGIFAFAREKRKKQQI